MLNVIVKSVWMFSIKYFFQIFSVHKNVLIKVSRIKFPPLPLDPTLQGIHSFVSDSYMPECLIAVFCLFDSAKI